jgi:starch synthase
MADSLKVIFTAAEASPLVKAGGLGDVVGSLPKALRRAGHDIRIILPNYGTINLEGYISRSLGSSSVPFMGSIESIEVNAVNLKDGTPVYLIDNWTYFHRSSIYGEQDDLQRFLFFSFSVMEALKIVNWQPNILHCHDWHTGIIPALLKIAYKDDPFYSQCSSVFTIHNIAYQGWFDDFFAEKAGLYHFLPNIDDPLRSKTYCMTGLGIYHSDVVSTVSDKYANEILTPEYGEGMDELILSRRDSLSGIVNGIDYDKLNPATDSNITVQYDVNSIEKRVQNKFALQNKAGLSVNQEIPVIGMAGRLVEQKGIDIAIQAIESLLARTEIQFILQGTGHSGYHESLEELQRRYPDRVRTYLTLDFLIARSIFAGCDIFLVPSRFEPCGLSPLIASHYGAIPVVRNTGGMAQNIIDYFNDPQNGFGFVFQRYEAGALLEALHIALTTFEKKNEWLSLMVRAMKADFSWYKSVPKYEVLYNTAINKITRWQI